MKKLICLCMVFCMLALSLAACKSNQNVNDANNTDDTNYGDIVNVNSTNYTYDSNGNLVKKQVVRNGEIIQSVTYEYDENNRLLKSVDKSLKSNNNYVDLWRTITNKYVYDDKGNVCVEYYDEETKYTETSVWKYDSNGNVINYNDNTFETLNVEYVYDSDGRLIEEKCNEPTDSDFSFAYNFYIKEYTYDQHGNLIQEDYKLYESEIKQIVVNNSKHYTYDENNLLIKKVEAGYYVDYICDEETWEILEWELIERESSNVEISYDDRGNVIEEHKKFFINGELNSESIYQYVYDENNNLITKIHNNIGLENRYSYDTNGNVIREETWIGDRQNGFISYTYDGNNRVTKAEYWNVLDLGPELVRTEEYQYDENGEVIKYLHKQSSTYSCKEHVYSYRYDNNGNIVEKKRESTLSDYNRTIVLNYTYAENKLQKTECSEVDIITGKLIPQDTSTYTYEFDSKNNVSKKTETVAYYEGEVYKTIVYTYEYTYDKEGNLVEECCERHQGEQVWTEYWKEYDTSGKIVRDQTGHKYEYDKNGNLTRKSYSYEDPNGSLYHTSIVEFTYDNGKLIKEEQTRYCKQLESNKSESGEITPEST